MGQKGLEVEVEFVQTFITLKDLRFKKWFILLVNCFTMYNLKQK